MRVPKIVSFSVVILLITVLFAGAVTVPAAARSIRCSTATTLRTRAITARSPGPCRQTASCCGTTPTGGGVESSPAVANGIVYVGSNDGNLYALNASTGAKLWQNAAGTDYTTSPAVANGVVYIGDQVVHALYASNGSELWNYTTGNYDVGSSPTVANGVVYVGASTEGNTLFALNANNGTLLWNYTMGYDVSNPAVANGVVYAGGWNGTFYALNASTGATLWQNAMGDTGKFTSVTVANGVIYVGRLGRSYTGVYALDANDGTKLWNSTTLSVDSDPAVANGVVYVGCSDGLYALNASTGATMWNYSNEDSPQSSYSSAAVANGVVYLGSAGEPGMEGPTPGAVYALYSNNGTKLWNYTTGDGVSASPAVANGVVYVGSGDTNVYAIGNRTSTLTAAPSKPIVAPGELFNINGALSTGNGGLPNENITLYNSTDNATWSEVSNTTTAADSNVGAYSFSVSENTLTTHYYKVAYAGNDSLDGSAAYATVNVVAPSTISVSAPSNVYVNQNFTVNGTLSDSAAGIGGATITLQRSTNNATWNNVTTNVTNATGGYQFSKNESAAGTYYYRTAYDGNDSYANATSNVVSVNVAASVAGAPSVSAQSASSLDLFFRGSDNALWWKHWNGATWTTAASQGGILTSDPVAASPGSGQIAVFVRGSDSAIWEKTTTNGGSTWSGWHSLGGQIPAGTSPAVCSWGSDRLDVFVQGTDGQLWHKWYIGTSWSGWQSLGGKLTSSAAATTALRSSRIDVFVRGTDGAVWYKDWNGAAWSGWHSLGGQIPVNTVPAACSWSSGRVDLFANGTDGQLWWKYTTNGGSSWTGWQALGRPLGESLTSSPAAAAPASGIMDVFVRGGNNGLWERTYGSGSWSGWTSIAV